jgi:hypothetical protein
LGNGLRQLSSKQEGATQVVVNLGIGRLQNQRLLILLHRRLGVAQLVKSDGEVVVGIREIGCERQRGFKAGNRS